MLAIHLHKTKYEKCFLSVHLLMEIIDGKCFVNIMFVYNW